MMFKKTGFLFFILVVLTAGSYWNCTVQPLTFKKGMDKFHAQDYDQAVKYLEMALKANPKSSEIRTQLFRAKLNSYFFHLGQARKYREFNKREQALDEYKKALSVFPYNKTLLDEFEVYLKGKKSTDTDEFKSSIKPPVRLKVDPNEKMTLRLKGGTPITQIFKTLGKSHKINFIFDKDFRDFIYSIEVEDIGFYEILEQLCMIANAKYRVVDESSILIYTNSSYKKRAYDLRGVKLFYLKNIKSEDAKNMIAQVFREEQPVVQDDPSLNRLIVKAPYEALVEIERFIANVDKGNSEVELNVEIMEVNRYILQTLGISYGIGDMSVRAGVLNGTDTSDTTGSTGSNFTNELDVSDLGDTNFFVTLPSASLDFLEGDDNTKIISKPNLRGVSGEEIKFMVGDELPVPQTTLAAVAAGGIATNPLTTFQYRNVGVEIRVTPHVHSGDEVTLKIKLTINFVTGYVSSGGEGSGNQFPVLGKRELENIIRLKKNETNIIGGFIRDEVRNSLTGLPFLNRIPVLGKLFGSSEKQIRQTDLIFSITPRVIKQVDIKDHELSPIWLNAPSGGSRQEGGEEGPGNQSPRPDDPAARRRRQPTPASTAQNTISIVPGNRRVPVNSFSYFTVRLRSGSDLNSLSISGDITGEDAVIEDVKTDFFKSDKIKVLKNFTPQGFDLGYSFFGEKVKNSILGQLKVKFQKKGEYTIRINSVNGYATDRSPVEFKSTEAKIQVN